MYFWNIIEYHSHFVQNTTKNKNNQKNNNKNIFSLLLLYQNIQSIIQIININKSQSGILYNKCEKLPIKLPYKFGCINIE